MLVSLGEESMKMLGCQHLLNLEVLTLMHSFWDLEVGHGKSFAQAPPNMLFCYSIVLFFIKVPSTTFLTKREAIQA